MAAQKQKAPNGVQKPKRSKKKKARTIVSSSSDSSESESDVLKKKGNKANGTSMQPINPKIELQDEANDSPEASIPQQRGSFESVKANVSPTPEPAEDFASLYLRKVTAELGDDLDKLREAKDFSDRSLPMLVHALRQGESIFSAEEKRRILGA